MKIRYVVLFFAAITVFIYSCSADYLNNSANAGLTTITLKANFETTTIGVDQEVILSVIGNDEIDYTSESILYMNGEVITENPVSFFEGGIYIFSASYNTLNSNLLTFEVVSEKYMTINTSKSLRGQEVTFNLYEVNGQDATQEATFFVNGSSIVGNTFSSINVGDYEVYAEYFDGINNVQTEVNSFSIFIPKRKVSYEDYTGSWCGWCPRVTSAIISLKEQTDNIVAIAIHNNDEMVHSVSQELLLRQQFNVAGFPSARLNRVGVVPTPEDQQTALDYVLSQAGVDTNLSIAIETELIGDLLSVKVKVISENGLSVDNKLVVYLYQNGIIFPQTNYYVNNPTSPWYNLGNPIPDFVHNDVLEVSLTNVLGDPILAVGPFEEYVTTFDPVQISNYAHSEGENSYDPNRFGVAVYLVNANNETLNAQHVKAGQSVGFE